MKSKIKKLKIKYGWVCPACGCGNAPMAMKCYHCPKIEYSQKDGSSLDIKINE